MILTVRCVSGPGDPRLRDTLPSRRGIVRVTAIITLVERAAILGVAVKVISNYTNHIARTPTDAFMKDTLWTPPSKRNEAA